MWECEGFCNNSSVECNNLEYLGLVRGLFNDCDGHFVL